MPEDWEKLQKEFDEEFQMKRKAWNKKWGFRFLLIFVAAFLFFGLLYISKDWETVSLRKTPTYDEEASTRCAKSNGVYYGKTLGDSGIEYVCAKK